MRARGYPVRGCADLAVPARDHTTRSATTRSRTRAGERSLRCTDHLAAARRAQCGTRVHALRARRRPPPAADAGDHRAAARAVAADAPAEARGDRPARGPDGARPAITAVVDRLQR